VGSTATEQFSLKKLKKNYILGLSSSTYIFIMNQSTAAAIVIVSAAAKVIAAEKIGTKVLQWWRATCGSAPKSDANAKVSRTWISRQQLIALLSKEPKPLTKTQRKAEKVRLKQEREEEELRRAAKTKASGAAEAHKEAMLKEKEDAAMEIAKRKAKAAANLAIEQERLMAQRTKSTHRAALKRESWPAAKREAYAAMQMAAGGGGGGGFDC